MRKLRAFLLAALLAASAAPAFAAPADDRPPAPVGRPPFLWGVTLSGFQNDGVTPEMDWYQLDRSDKILEKVGKGPDFRGHMDADLDRAESLGLNAFRTSFEWARLEPKEGQFDPAEVAYCHRLLDGIKKRGMQPIITLHHFVSPAWAYQDAGDGLLGWESPKMVEKYLRYVDFVAKEFGRDITYFITLNEPSTVILGGYTLGVIAPHRSGPGPFLRAAQNLLAAHIGAYERLHAANPHAMVSLTEYNSYFMANQSIDLGVPVMPGQLLGLLLEKVRSWDGTPRVKYLDFVGLHYYGSQDPVSATAFPVQPYNWRSRPDELRTILKAYYDTFKLPILVAENGFATKDGAPREDGWTREQYLVSHIREIQEARAEGLPIMGYCYWTLTDNYEWGSFSPRFGLWRVDALKGDLVRRETPAVAVYRDIIKHNGVTPELARRYPPPGTPSASVGSLTPPPRP